MVQLNKEVLPTDEFIISIPQSLSMNERQLLTLLYQPLTGANPISLYLLLWAEGEADNSEEMTHYYLMNVLDMPLRTIFEARIGLEAIGLLRTYRKDVDNRRQFIYELIRPLDAQQFFSDPLLSMFLYSKIGEQAYRRLRNRYAAQVNKDGFEEVSRTFTDVYKPVNVRMNVGGIDSETLPKSYPFYLEQFDFDLLKAGLSEQLVPTKILTAEVREYIAKLAFMYNLTPIEMQKVVILAFDDENHFSTDRLKKAAADYYKISISKQPPQLTKVLKEIPVTERQLKEELSKEQELLHYLENTSPIEVLRAINGGKEPLQSSVEIVEDLIVKHEMPVGVVNVLIEYVMLSTDMKLPRKYVERIADHWMRKELKTAKEAMDLARKERDQYAKWKSDNEAKAKQPQGNTSNYRPRKSQGRTEQVPEWFYTRNDQKVQASVKNEKSISTAEQSVQAKSDPVSNELTTKEIDFEKEREKILRKLGQTGR